MSKISESQRKYFVQRVQDQVDDVIRTLEHKNAKRTIEISTKHFDSYLDDLGVKKKLKEVMKLRDKTVELTDELKPVLDTIRAALNLSNGYDSNMIWISDSTTARDWEKAFKICCNKAAQQNESITPIGKEILKLKEKKKQAVDFLYGFSDEAELKQGVNRILTGTGITLLKEKS
jgi:Mg2+ and Co2+ transporter CorA